MFPSGWLLCFLQVLSSFLLIGFEVPVFLLVAVPILVVYYFIQVRKLSLKFASIFFTSTFNFLF